MNLPRVLLEKLCNQTPRFHLKFSSEYITKLHRTILFFKLYLSLNKITQFNIDRYVQGIRNKLIFISQSSTCTITIDSVLSRGQV